MKSASWASVSPDKLEAFKSWAVANHDKVTFGLPQSDGSQTGTVSGHVAFIGWAFTFAYNAATQSLTISPLNHNDAIIAKAITALGQPASEA